MKRLYIGAGIGMGITFLFPAAQVESILQPIVRVIINVGRYFLLPSLFFGILTSFVYQITTSTRSTRKGTKATEKKKKPAMWFKSLSASLHLRLFLVLVCTTILLVIIGGGGVLLFSLPHLSIIFQESEPIVPLGLEEIVLRTFPHNMFSIFTQAGDFILPLAVFAILFGIAMRHYSKSTTLLPKLTMELSDIFNNMLDVYINLLGIGMVVISAYITVQIRSIENIELFYQIIFIVSALTVGIILIVYPLIAIILRCKMRPIALIRNMLSATVISVLSGDSHFSSIMVLRLFRSRFREHREIPYTLTVMGMLFSKAGSAFIASVAFFTILKSYIAVEISFFHIVWIMGMIVIFSPLASTSPKLGAVHLLIAVATLYGNGLENGFLIILPLLPFLISVATLLDTLTVVFFGYLMADKLDVPYPSSTA